MFQRTVFMMPSRTVFVRIGVYTLYSLHAQWFDKTIVYLNYNEATGMTCPQANKQSIKVVCIIKV
ncbi:hypothetical protein XAC3608_1710002 [Xanthomonas citri pv. citri]|nr:hypothetical protein XAC3608_1710002 [Xanthomonas citri pv. citri]